MLIPKLRISNTKVSDYKNKVYDMVLNNIIMGLLKNAHLLCCAANRTAQRISIYASRFGFLRASHLNIFEQPPNMGYFNNPNGQLSDAVW
jgi:hypothetical protein